MPFLTSSQYLFSLKRGDTRPSLRVQLLYKDNSKIDVAGATITFRFWKADEPSRLFSGSVTVEDAGESIVRYDWVSGDTNLEGDYEGEFMLDYGSGEVMSVPEDGYIRFRILPRLQ
jgi:hypothetical protein